MAEQPRCALCGNPIEAGEAWMRADADAAERRAHVECLYRDEHDPASIIGWEPQEHAAGS